MSRKSGTGSQSRGIQKKLDPQLPKPREINWEYLLFKPYVLHLIKKNEENKISNKSWCPMTSEKLTMT